MLKKLKEIIEEQEGMVEIRYHRREYLTLQVKNGVLTRSEMTNLAGAGIRTLVDGCWGFVSTSDLSREGIEKAITEARQAASEAGVMRKNKIEGLAEGQTGKGSFSFAEKKEDPPLEEKIETVLNADQKVREAGEEIIGSTVSYAEYRDQKVIVNTDGVEAEIYDPKCDVSVTAFGMKDGNREMGRASHGLTGHWEDLFAEKELDDFAEEAVEKVHHKLEADYVKGGRYTVILDPALVGVLAHEAIGHTVEADFVESGSAVKDKIGEQVASELVNMVDDGSIERAAGRTVVDDEGTLSEKTMIIEKGILKNYLHNRESAYKFDTTPNGNARAFTYRDEPLIRMTNTFIEAGEDDLEEMISEVEDGFFLKEMGQGGQADATAEFMFDVMEAYRIKDGKIQDPVKGITISGQAFEVLKSVDAVSSDFEFGLGRGYCGKWQMAKVDAGGPYIRCEVMIGGQK